MPLDVCQRLEPVAKLEHPKERRVYVGTRLCVADTEAAAVSVVEQLHLSSLAAAASIIARKVMPEPRNAPAKNMHRLLICFASYQCEGFDLMLPAANVRIIDIEGAS